jgi:predicted secreted protein
MEEEELIRRFMEILVDYLAEIIAKCLDDGMVLPFIVCFISPDGNVYAARFVGLDIGMRELAKHFEPEGKRIPATVVIVDQNNTAVRVSINREGLTYSE